MQRITWDFCAWALSLAEHTISKFGGDPCPVRRGLVVAVKGYVRKTRVFLCRQRTEMTHHYRRHCSRVSVRWREILFCFLSSDPIIVGLSLVSCDGCSCIRTVGPESSGHKITVHVVLLSILAQTSYLRDARYGTYTHSTTDSTWLIIVAIRNLLDTHT